MPPKRPRRRRSRNPGLLRPRTAYRGPLTAERRGKMELTEAFAEYLAEHASNYHGRNVCVTIEDISLAMEPLSEIMTRLSKRLNEEG